MLAYLHHQLTGFDKTIDSSSQHTLQTCALDGSNGNSSNGVNSNGNSSLNGSHHA
jgi:hypothetical protein